MHFFEKKVAFQVIDFASFLPYIWRGICKRMGSLLVDGPVMVAFLLVF